VVFTVIDPGDYRVRLVRDVYGSEHVTVIVNGGSSYQLRLLSEGVLGYV